jgi:4-amino-4-deoxy-L-arabinose transferase-like glycosyltransferase
VGGWLLVTGLVFSYMLGIVHPYYTVALAPAIGALTGIGGARLWRDRHTRSARVTLSAAVAATGAWAWVLLGRTPAWLPWLRVVIVIVAAAAAGLIMAGTGTRAATGRSRTALGAATVSLVLAAVLAGPLASSIDTAATTHGGTVPSAGPVTPAIGAMTDVHSPVVRLLEADAPGYRWVAATVGSTTAASLELSTGGRPVMAIGGFTGRDPAPSLAEFERLVSGHKIHYFISSGLGGSGDPAQITSWVRSHLKAETIGGMLVYNLAALAPPRDLTTGCLLPNGFLTGHSWGDLFRSSG